MNGMQEINIAGFDLNLLKAFDALLRERGVTPAARRIGLSQPAMSHALGRLRQLFKDPLFVRTPQGMEPTPRARELAAHIGPALDRLRGALSLGATFEPRLSQRAFTIGIAEYAEIALVDRLAAAFRVAAPLADLRLVATSGPDILKRLDAGSVDLVLAHLGAMPPRIEARVAYRDPFVALTRRRHPAVAPPISLEQYARLPHVLVSPRGVATGGIDGQLAQHGLKRRIALVVSTYLALPLLLARSDLVAAAPSRAAARIAALGKLDIHPLPFAGAVEVGMAWHRRDATEPAQSWFRALVEAVVHEIF
jgi:DNA-binding transcriptional LysR family regulator